MTTPKRSLFYTLRYPRVCLWRLDDLQRVVLEVEVEHAPPHAVGLQPVLGHPLQEVRVEAEDLNNIEKCLVVVKC